MRYIAGRDQGPSAPRKLGYALVGLSIALGGSAALGWQNSSVKPRMTQIEEAVLPTPVATPDEKVLGSSPPKAVAATPKSTSPAPESAKKTQIPVTIAPPPVAKPAAVAKPAVAKPAITVASPASTARESTAPTTKRKPLVATNKATATAPSKPRARSLLPFPIPGFGNSNSASDTAKTEVVVSEPATRRETPSASAKALGNATKRRTAPAAEEQSPPAVAAPAKPVAIAEETQPTPARREPRVATRPRPQVVTSPAVAAPTPVVKPAPVKPAPVVKPAPIAAAPAKPAPPKVARPKLATVTKKLAPLEFAAHTDIQPAGFQDITPGKTKLSGIAKQLGEPLSTELQGDTSVMTYEVGPFPKVEIILVGDIVDSVVIHLKEPVAESDILNELSLAQFAGVAVLDESGKVLGKAIPERGVAMSYEGDPANGHVGQVVLATITAEPFLLRAASGNHYGSMLADATYAQSLDSSSAQALAIRARVLAKLGRVSEAKSAIEAALKLDNGACDDRLLYAKLLAQLGDFASAIKMVEAVATTEGVSPEFVAQAELQWGQLLADGPEHNYPVAIEHMTRAIKLATSLSMSDEPALRRAALRTAVDANLAVAASIAAGNYKRKPEVVPKWIAKAETIAAVALKDGADPYLQLHVATQSLAAFAKMEEPVDPTSTVEAALNAGQELIGDAEDPLYKRQLEWELGCALLNAVTVEHIRGEFEIAIQYVNNALVLLGDNAPYREATPQREYLLGKLFFATGALYAIGHEDHPEAVHYYLQALPLLTEPLPAELRVETSAHGERFVSMGVSFWQNGNKQQAVELTLAGVQHLRDAITEEQADNDALAVPYGNLAAMYRQLGNATEANKYADLAKRVDSKTTVQR